MPLRFSLALAALAAAAQEPVEYRAYIRSIQGSTVVLTSGDYSYRYQPRIGDRATFSTRIPGVGKADLQGEWKVVRLLPETRTFAIEPPAAGAAIPGPKDLAVIRAIAETGSFRPRPDHPPLVQLIEHHRCGRAAEMLRAAPDGAAATTALPHFPHCPDLLPMLLAAGADPNRVEAGSSPPLHMAVHAGDPDAVRALLLAKADANHRGYNGQTALVVAIEKKDAELVRILVEGGADRSVPDDKQLTARDYARDTRNPEIIRLIDPSAPVSSADSAPPGLAAPGPLPSNAVAARTETSPPDPPPQTSAAPAATLTLRHAHPSFTKFYFATATLTLLPGEIVYKETADNVKLEHDFRTDCREFRRVRILSLNRAERKAVAFLSDPAKLMLDAGKRRSQYFEERTTLAEVVRTLKQHCGKR